MTATPHRTYPNPTIVEALCEIHFELSPENPWKASLPGAFYRRIQNDYPEMEPVQETGLRIDLALQLVVPAQSRIRFRDAENTRLLQLSETTLTINILPPYLGWDFMRATILNAWQNAVQTLLPTGISQIGLRYINRIPRLSVDEKASEWLRSTDFIPPLILSSDPGFLLRVQSVDYQNRLNITLGYDASNTAGEHGAIVFDIDRISQRVMPSSEDTLSTEVDRLHEDVWHIFEQAKSERLTDLLEQGRT